MMWYYESEIAPFGREYKDRGMLDDREETLEELYEKQKWLEQRISEQRLKEPPKKRNKIGDYRVWFAVTYDYIDELHKVRDEIEKRVKQ